MKRRMPAGSTLATAVAAALATAACGGDMASDDDAVDAGGSDGATGCSIAVSFAPTMPVAPATIVAQSDVFGSSGITTYVWRVTLRATGAEVPFTPLDASSRDIQFDAPTAGIYDVDLFVGAGCPSFDGAVNVMTPGANTRAVRLRFVPPASITAPPQERIVIVPGGADFAAGVLTLDAGNAYPINVRTPTATAVPAYVRFTSRSTPDAVIEGFTDSAGNTAVRLIPGRYDVLVVPTSAALAPRLVLDWDPLTTLITIDAGTALGGFVLDDAGAAVAGARVSLTSGGVPSTVATTVADGSFSLRWREGGTIEQVTAVPPAASSLPRLDAQVEIGALAVVTVRHATVPSSDVASTLVRVGGVIAASTEVVVDLGRAGAGTIRDGSTILAAASGSHRRTLRTDAAGRLPSARFIDGTGAAFITASGGPGGVAALALPLGGTLDAAAPVTITGRVLRAAGGARAEARVRATLTGALAHAGAPVPVATAGSDGSFTIALAAGGAYALLLIDPTADDAARTVAIASATAQALGDLSLPAALAISGEVRATGQSVGARAVGVAALCHLACAGIERTRPLGDAVTDPAGRFVVAVPDPGVAQ